MKHEEGGSGTWVDIRRCTGRSRAGASYRRLGWALSALVSLPSCYHYYVKPERVPLATEAESRTGVHFFWGLMQAEDITPECPPGVPLAEVATETNYGYVLIGALSLGIVLPQTLRWRCAKLPPKVDILQRAAPAQL